MKNTFKRFISLICALTMLSSIIGGLAEPVEGITEEQQAPLEEVLESVPEPEPVPEPVVEQVQEPEPVQEQMQEPEIPAPEPPAEESHHEEVSPEAPADDVPQGGGREEAPPAQPEQQPAPQQEEPPAKTGQEEQEEEPRQPLPQPQDDGQGPAGNEGEAGSVHDAPSEGQKEQGSEAGQVPEGSSGQEDGSGEAGSSRPGGDQTPGEDDSSVENGGGEEGRADESGSDDGDLDLSSLTELVVDGVPVTETVDPENPVRLKLIAKRTEKILLTVMTAAGKEVRLDADGDQLKPAGKSADGETGRQTILYELDAEAGKTCLLTISSEKTVEFSIEAARAKKESPENEDMNQDGEENEEEAGKIDESDPEENPDETKADPEKEENPEEPAGEDHPEELTGEDNAEDNLEEGEAGDGEEDPETAEPQLSAGGTLTASVSDCTVTVQYGEEALFPENVTLSVEEILPGTARYAELTGMTEEMLTDDWNEAGEFQRVFDITFRDGEQEIEPAAQIQVDFQFHTPVTLEENSSLQVVHVDQQNNAEIVSSDTSAVPAEDRGARDVDGVSFSSDSFSAYVVFQTKQITSKTIEDEEHSVSITYGRENGIPENAQVSVTKIEEGTEAYETFRKQLIQQLNLDEKRQTVLFSALYDITILDENNGEVSLSEDTTVTVTAELPAETARTEDLLVVHFDGSGDGASELEATTEDNVVTFETGGFSVYGFAYTVDYAYGGREYHMQGESSITLSELFTMLEIPEKAADAVKVEFSSEELIRVEQIESDWLLTSLRPFLTEESLTVTLADGRMILITVTDDAGDPWYIDENGVLHIISDEAMNFTSAGNAPWYSQREEITSIAIEDGVTKIPQNFVNSTEYTSLTDVTIADSVQSMGVNAFYGCPALKNVQMGTGIKQLPNNAFYNCTALESINLENLTSIGDNSFYGCSALENVSLTEGLTSVGAYAFRGCSALESVSLPDSLTSLGNQAFYQCSALESVNIPNGLTKIGDYTFYGCSALKELDIPEGVTAVGQYAFYGCSSLTSLDFPEGLTSFGSSSFANCSSVASIHIPDSNNEIIIGSYAFQNASSLTSIQLPEGLKTLNYYTFYNCPNLKDVRIPSTVTSINSNAFTSCGNIEEFIFDENNTMTTVPSIFSSRSNLKKVVLPRNMSAVPDSLFSGCTKLEEVELSDMVQKIGASAFYNCSKLTELEMPQYLESIGATAFYNTGLDKVELPPSVKTMGSEAFRNCTFLESVDLENTQLKTLPYGAFRNCSNLETVSFPKELTSIGNHCFANCTKLIVDETRPGELIIPSTVTSIGEEAFQGAKAITKLVIPDSVTSLGTKAFLNCSNLEDVSVGAGITSFPTGLFMNNSKLRRVSFASNDSIKSIPYQAFYGCSQLEDFDMPASVETIGGSAFYNCSKLTEADFPATLKSINTYAYYGCTGLKQTTFQDGTSPLEIANYAFQNCSGLTSVAFPANLKRIGQYAYNGCSNLSQISFKDGTNDLTIDYAAFQNLSKLTDVDFPTNLVSIGSYAFYNDTAITAITIPAEGKDVSIGSYAFSGTGLKTLTEEALPDRVKSIGDRAFLSCKQLTTVKLPAEITELKTSVFNGCTALTSVTLNDKLETIGNSAFNGCTALPSITLTEKVETIDTSAFSGCTGLKSITFNDKLKTIGNSAFNNCDGLTSLNLPSSLRTIGASAFNDCDGLTSLSVPSGVTSIGNSAFYSCDKLTTVNLADSVTSMGTSVFQYCTSLKDARLPAGITTLPANTFYGCTRLDSAVFTACTDLTTIGPSAFYDCKNLPSVDLTPCTSLTTIDASAFQNCDHMTAVTLPTSLTTVGNNAFKGCSRLSTLTIPQNTASIGTDALTGCQSLENLIWDAANGTIGAFSSGTHFPLTLGRHVDTLSEEALTNLCNGGANMLVFQGENDLTLPALSGHGLPRPLDNLGAGNYHADQHGALYRIEEGEDGTKHATLVYVPDGLTTYTIPETLAADDGSSIPVTGVGADALYAAQTLKTLDVAAPESFTVIASGAFAGARNLESVGGKNKKSEAAALFTNAEKGVLLFENTKLLEDEGYQPFVEGALQYGICEKDGQPYIDPRDVAKGWPSNILVTISQAAKTRRTASGDPGYQKDSADMPRDAQGTYLAFTGDALTTSIIVSNPASETLVETKDKIRIYFKTDEGCDIPDYPVGATVPLQVKQTLPDGTETTYSVDVHVVSTDAPGVRYLEVERPRNGATLSFTVSSEYQSPFSRGGDVVVWAEFVKEGEESLLAGKATNPGEKRQVVNRITIPDPFAIDKTAGSTSVLAPVADTDGRAYIPSHSYTINLRRANGDPANPFLNNSGKDYFVSADIVDQTELPEGVILNPTIVEEIKNNRITTTTSTSSYYKTTTHTIASPTYGTLFTVYESNLNQNYLAPVLSLTEDERNAVLTWHLVNKKYEDCLAGKADTYIEMPVHNVTVTVYGKVLCMDLEKAEKDTVYTIKNKVDATLHYNHSGDALLSDDAAYKVNSGDAKMEFSKAHASSGTIYRGEYRPYTLTLKSTGILPLTLNEMDRIVDVIDTNASSYPDSHYIDAKGIWQMFTDPSNVFGSTPLNDLLTLTISRAHLYGKDGYPLGQTQHTVITDKGTLGSVQTSQANTSANTAYSGMSNSDPGDRGAIATFVFSKDEQGNVKCSVNGGEGETVSSAESIQNLFDRYGFFVTRDTRYTVDWNLTPLGSDFRLPSGSSLVITIPTHIKDVFMRINGDKREYEPSTYSSYEYAYNRADVKKGSDTVKSAKSEPYHYREAYLYKSVSGVASTEHIYEYHDDAIPDQTYYDVVQYTVNPQHNGTASYDLMPLTDHMTNRQALLVPVTQNAGLDWTEGLETYRVDGVDYYLLTREDTYSRVWTGDCWADHVEVQPMSGGRYDTKIFWYLTDYRGSFNKKIQYKARVWLNDLTGAQVGYPMTSCTNESWLGDHQAHRLYDSVSTSYGEVQSEALVREWSKRIVDEVYDTRPGYRYCAITQGKTVVYRLRFANDKKKDFTLTGKDFYDVLPRAVGFSWVKDDNVLIYYDNFSVSDPDAWKIEKFTVNGFSDEYRIKWDDQFSMTCTDTENGIGYVYVKVTFPTGTGWDTYVHSKTNNTLNNTLYVKNTSGTFSKQSVDHDLADKAVVRLQKGVYGTAVRYQNGTESFKTTDNSRELYENGDVTETRVYYYITLHNGGYTNLYLTPLQDVLPRGFKVEKVYQAYSNYYYGEKLASVRRGNDGPSENYPDSLGLSYSTQTVGDRERVTITLQPDNQYNDHTGQKEWYLKPGQAAVLMMVCSVAGEPGATDNDATNVIAMPYRDYFYTGLHMADSTSSPAAVGGANPRQNNGGCEVIDNVTAGGKGCAASPDNTTQWLCSEVTIRRGDIRPGINKYLQKVIAIDGKVKRPAPSTINSQETLIWSVTNMNSGDRSIVDYAITDVLPNPYNFVGEVCYRQMYNLAGEAEPEPEILFTIERGKEDAAGQEITEDNPGEAVGASRSMTLKSRDGEQATLTIGDAHPTVIHFKGSEIQVRIDLDEDGNEVMSIRFPDKAMNIPAGGEVELTYTTKYIMSERINAVLVNFAYLTPLEQSWDGQTNHGNAVKYASPYSDTHDQSVISNAQVVSSYGGSTTSLKAIREKENETNLTDCTKNPNYITVRDRSRTVTYTLSVKNDNVFAISELVLLDNLPERGDHTVFNVRDKRESAFRVHLEQNPNFELWVKKENGDRIELERGKDKDYEIQFHSRTTFRNIDWDSEQDAGWQDWNGESLSAEETENIHSIRLVFHDATNQLYPAGGELFMEFDARIDEDDEGAKPGAIAYNGFGYKYKLSTGLDGQAAPRLVGVRIPDLPHIKKSLVDSQDRNYETRTDVSFRYVLYQGNAVTPGTIDAIREAKRDYAVVTVMVPEGSHLSETDVSFNYPDEVQLCRDGQYTTGEWVMNPGQKYTLLELPTEHYESVSLGGKTGNSYSFTYDSAQVLTLNSINRHDDWSFRLVKQDQYQRPVSGAVFAVYTSLAEEAMTQQEYEALEDDKPAYELEEDYEGYKLMAVRATNEVGIFQLDLLAGTTYICLEQSVPSELYTLNQEPLAVIRENKERLKRVTFVNQYNSSGTGSFTLHKHMQGRPLEDEEFRFRIEPYDPLARKVITEAEKMPPMPEKTENIPNNGEGEVTFGPFSFETKDIGKEYCYLVTEIIPEEQEEHVVYDQTKGIVRGRVSDDGTGTLSAEWTYTRLNSRNEEVEWNGTFNNAYVSETRISIPVSKNLTGKDWEADDSFTFHLVDVTDPENPKDEKVKVTDGNLITFDRTYTHLDDGITFSYDLYEDIPDSAVGYKPNDERMKVIIGNQRVVVTYGVYKNWTEAERASRIGDTRLRWKARGIFYDDTVHHIEVKVNYDDGVKGVKADVTLDGQPVQADNIGEIQFKNQFKPENIKATIKASKKIWWPDKNQYRRMGLAEAYTFKLIPDDPDQPMPDVDTVTLTSGPLEEVYKSFTVPLSWDALISKGTMDEETGLITAEFFYTLVELKPDGTAAAAEDPWIDQIKYDSTSRRVKIVMTGDSADFSMSAETLYQDASKVDSEWAKYNQKFFQNEYRTDPIGFRVEIEKRLNQKGARQGSYSFTLYDASDHSQVKTITMDNPDGQILSSSITVEDLGEKGGLKDKETRNYYLLENIPAEATAFGKDGSPISPEVKYGEGAHRDDYTWKLNGYTYDTHRINITVTASLDQTFTYKLISSVTYGTFNKAIYSNGYEAEGSKTVKVGKKIDGRGFLPEESFTFEMVPLDGAPMRTAGGNKPKLIVTADSAEAVPFDELLFSLDDLKNGDGTWSEKDFSYIIHECVPDDASVQDGENELFYRDATEDQKKAFDGKWTCNGMTYAKDRLVTLHAEDDAEGHVDVTFLEGTDESGTAEMVNRYAAEGSFTASVAKSIEKREYRENESFTFELTPVDGAPLRTEAGSEDKLIVTAVSPEKVSFDELLFNAADLKNSDGTWSEKYFSYIIHEVVPDDAFVTSEEDRIIYKNATDGQKQDFAGKWQDKGITYAEDQTVTLHVEDDGAGSLTVSCTEGLNESGRADFTNYYDAVGSGTVSVKKTVDGREFREDESFTFELTPVDGAPLRTAEGIQEKLTLTAESEEAMSFDELQFRLEDLTSADGSWSGKDFSYTIHEIVPEDASVMNGTNRIFYRNATEAQKRMYAGKWAYEGLVYAEDQTITLHVEEVGEGVLSVTCHDEAANPAEVSFVNEYRPELVTTSILAQKAWLNYDGTTEPPAGARVIFELYADGEATGKTVELDGKAERNLTESSLKGEAEAWQAVWNNLNVYRRDAEGNCIPEGDDFQRVEYTVRETSLWLPAIRYEVYISDESEEGAKASGDEPGIVTITNEQQTGSLTIEKKVDTPVPSERNKEFNFRIELKDRTIEGEFDGVTFTGGAAEVSVRGGESLTITGLPQGVGYTVTEQAEILFTPDEAAKSGTIGEEVSTASFINTRIAVPGTAVLKGHKVIQNRPFARDDTLKVKVSAAEGVKLPEITEIDVPLKEGEFTASFSFGEITYELSDMDGEIEKIFTYLITETAQMEGTTPDAGTHTAVVKVTDDGKGHLLTEVTYSDGQEIEFVNPYARKGTLSLEKIFEFRQPNATTAPMTPEPGNVPEATPGTGEPETGTMIPTTSMTVRKIWNDDNNAAGIRPDHVTVMLNNGMKVTLNEQNGWQATISDLPLVINGRPAAYYWKETEVPGYRLVRTTVVGAATIFVNEPHRRGTAPAGKPVGKPRGNQYMVIEEYGTPLGVEAVINHVGDCFD